VISPAKLNQIPQANLRKLINTSSESIDPSR
jgi:hypothetical protein